MYEKRNDKIDCPAQSGTPDWGLTILILNMIKIVLVQLMCFTLNIGQENVIGTKWMWNT